MSSPCRDRARRLLASPSSPSRPAMPRPVAHRRPLVTTPTTDPNDVAPAVADLDTIVSLSKRRGFIFPSSEIYGGINAVWDYGPLGVELKNNVKRAWWRAMVQERDDIVGLDAGILMHPQVWVTSGHVGSFSDPLVECQTDHRRFRLDELPGAEDLSATDLRGPGDRRAARAQVPRGRRAAVAAAPVQPDVQDVHGPGRGGRLGHLPAPGDRPGLVRQLQERPAVVAQEAAVRDRPDRQVVPQRDQPGQLRLPDARVRADGDAVLRPARGRGGRRIRGVAAAAPGLVRALRRDAVAAAPARARARRAGALREEGGRRRIPLPVRLEGARGRPQPRRLRPVAPPRGVAARASSTSTRRPTSTSSRGSSRRPPAPTGRRSRS